ncbi:hypothetical protein MGL_3235 [Malassezia globosa CBS 7966]|uniref:LSM complex subunit LSM4 n=1 Tax=Malassezia globosa (strain ATCC MYA-4612 / CBS 7966) TaxID=425265 RepID=A8Q8A5_MALGO|nr:uncharacterized protein MGL_3235 [Malassezia globosa CBS 7966]EDP42477.1 hypothetical protein MGL_3235 [Malassezia globosa CBS 7966]
MLPLTLLNAAHDGPILVELKNSETFNGHLVACDNYMNITMRDVFQTSSSGEQFWKMPEVYIKGSTVCTLFRAHECPRSSIVVWHMN